MVPSGLPQVSPCEVGSRPVPGGGAVGYCVPFGWSGLFRCLGAQRPSGRSAPLPRLPGGGPHFSREMGRKRAGAPPLDPTFYSRSLPLAGFWDRYPWYDSGTTSSGMLRPIWDAFSSKKYAEKEFCKRKSPNQGTYMGLVIAHRPKQCTTTAKTSEWERAALKAGGRGVTPATLCVRAFSRESLDPPPGTGRETTLQVWTGAGPARSFSLTGGRRAPRPPPQGDPNGNPWPGRSPGG